MQLKVELTIWGKPAGKIAWEAWELLGCRGRRQWSLAQHSPAWELARSSSGRPRTCQCQRSTDRRRWSSRLLPWPGLTRSVIQQFSSYQLASCLFLGDGEMAEAGQWVPWARFATPHQIQLLRTSTCSSQLVGWPLCDLPYLPLWQCGHGFVSACPGGKPSLSEKSKTKKIIELIHLSFKKPLPKKPPTKTSIKVLNVLHLNI